MIDQSRTCNPPILPDADNATSSPGSEAGVTLYDWQAFQTALLFGQAPAHANRFRAQGSEEAKRTNGTSGLISTVSSRSAALQSALESRLRARMDVNGSPEYALTWKHWDMPSGRPICALRASGRRISANACTGWLTPKVQTGKYQRSNGRICLNLEGQVDLAGWPTSASRDWKDGAECPNVPDNALLGRVVHQAGWPSPTATKTTPQSRDNACLARDCLLAGWQTPKTPSGGGQSARETEGGGLRKLEDQALGLTPTGTPVETVKPVAYQLNPRFSLWLQGYPTEWASCGAQAMQSCRKSRRRSSKPASKP
jgi:hypothetical protein